MTARVLAAPALAATAAVRRPAPIDLVHLARQTFGSLDLEREVLHLFVAQSRELVVRLRAAPAGERGALAHRLKGSARGVGARRVAEICGLLEAPELAESEVRRVVGDLAEAVDEVRVFVDAIA